MICPHCGHEFNPQQQNVTPEPYKIHTNFHGSGDPTEYPEHLWKVAEALRDIWRFDLPDKPARPKEKSEYTFFLMAMDDLRMASGEFQTQILLQKIHEDFMAYAIKHGGTFPFPVGRPTALVNAVRSKALELRNANKKETSINPYESLSRYLEAKK